MKKFIKALVAAFAIAISFSGCFLFAPSAEIKITNSAPFYAIGGDCISTITVTSETGKKEVDAYQPVTRVGIVDYKGIMGGYSESVYVYDAGKYTVSIETTKGAFSTEVEITEIPSTVEVVFNGSSFVEKKAASDAE